MKILFLSDLHMREDFINNLKGFSRKVDVVVNCGDITGRRKPYRETQPKDLELYLSLLDGVEHYFILGNDDFFETDHPRRLREPVKLGDVWLVPFEYVPFTPFNSMREKSEEEMRELLARIPPLSPFIFVTHSPPYGVLDFGGIGVPRHLGSVALREFVIERRPIVHAFGHIHEAAGHVFQNGTHFLNCAWGNFYIVEVMGSCVEKVERVPSPVERDDG